MSPAVHPHQPASPAAESDASWVDSNGLRLLTWRAFEPYPVDAVITTRTGGISEGPYASLNLALHVGDEEPRVIENRQRAARAIGAGLEDLVFANQVHGREVAEVTKADSGRGATSLRTAIEGVDGLITSVAGPVLVTMVADCVPVILYDRDAHVAGVVHSGWRGTVARVLQPAVEAMEDLGARPGAIIAGIGPAADASTYEVGPEVVDAVIASFGSEQGLLEPSASGRHLLNLPEANRRVLLDAGLRSDAIHGAGFPTGVVGPFFSDRAARPCGRFAALVRLH